MDKVYIEALGSEFPLVRLTDDGEAIFLRNGRKLVARPGTWAYRAA